MASNTENTQDFHLRITKAIFRKLRNPSANKGLGDQFLDLNYPPVNSSAGNAHATSMESGFEREIKRRNRENGTGKELDMSLKSWEKSNEEFIRNYQSSTKKPRLYNELAVKTTPTWDLLMEPNPINETNVRSLVCMGCTYCHMYVMVSERDPKCPNCRSYLFLDISFA